MKFIFCLILTLILIELYSFKFRFPEPKAREEKNNKPIKNNKEVIPKKAKFKQDDHERKSGDDDDEDNEDDEGDKVNEDDKDDKDDDDEDEGDEEDEEGTFNECNNQEPTSVLPVTNLSLTPIETCSDLENKSSKLIAMCHGDKGLETTDLNLNSCIQVSKNGRLKYFSKPSKKKQFIFDQAVRYCSLSNFILSCKMKKDDTINAIDLREGIGNNQGKLACSQFPLKKAQAEDDFYKTCISIAYDSATGFLRGICKNRKNVYVPAKINLNHCISYEKDLLVWKAPENDQKNLISCRFGTYLIYDCIDKGDPKKTHSIEYLDKIINQDGKLICKNMQQQKDIKQYAPHSYKSIDFPHIMPLSNIDKNPIKTCQIYLKSPINPILLVQCPGIQKEIELNNYISSNNCLMKWNNKTPYNLNGFFTLSGTILICSTKANGIITYNAIDLNEKFSFDKNNVEYIEQKTIDDKSGYNAFYKTCNDFYYEIKKGILKAKCIDENGSNPKEESLDLSTCRASKEGNMKEVLSKAMKEECETKLEEDLSCLVKNFNVVKNIMNINGYLVCPEKIHDLENNKRIPPEKQFTNFDSKHISQVSGKFIEKPNSIYTPQVDNIKEKNNKIKQSDKEQANPEMKIIQKQDDNLTEQSKEKNASHKQDDKVKTHLVEKKKLDDNNSKKMDDIQLHLENKNSKETNNPTVPKLDDSTRVIKLADKSILQTVDNNANQLSDIQVLKEHRKIKQNEKHLKKHQDKQLYHKEKDKTIKKSAKRHEKKHKSQNDEKKWLQGLLEPEEDKPTTVEQAQDIESPKQEDKKNRAIIEDTNVLQIDQILTSKSFEEINPKSTIKQITKDDNFITQDIEKPLLKLNERNITKSESIEIRQSKDSEIETDKPKEILIKPLSSCINFKYESPFLNAECQMEENSIPAKLDLNNCIQSQKNGHMIWGKGGFSKDYTSCSIYKQILICSKNSIFNAIDLNAGIINVNGKLDCMISPAAIKSVGEFYKSCSNYQYIQSKGLLRAECLNNNLKPIPTYLQLRKYIAINDRGQLNWKEDGSSLTFLRGCSIMDGHSLDCSNQGKDLKLEILEEVINKDGILSPLDNKQQKNDFIPIELSISGNPPENDSSPCAIVDYFEGTLRSMCKTENGNVESELNLDQCIGSAQDLDLNWTINGNFYLNYEECFVHVKYLICTKDYVTYNSIDLTQGIAQEQGKLTCMKNSQPKVYKLEKNYFISTCRNYQIQGRILKATCLTGDGVGEKETKIKLSKCLEDFKSDIGDSCQLENGYMIACTGEKQGEKKEYNIPAVIRNNKGTIKCSKKGETILIPNTTIQKKNDKNGANNDTANAPRKEEKYPKHEHTKSRLISAFLGTYKNHPIMSRFLKKENNS